MTPACAVCGRTFSTKHTGRKPQFCSNRCRDTNRRQLNFDFCHETKIKPAGALKKLGRYPYQANPRNASNSSTISNPCKAKNGGRGSPINGFWRRIVEVEVIGAREWREVVSTDGVVSWVAYLKPRALVDKPRGAP
jgi:hypothetical protein